MEEVATVVLALLIAAVLFVVIYALGGWVTMALWNWLVPLLFHGPVLEFWQAVGMYALCRTLFGSSGSTTSKD